MNLMRAGSGRKLTEELVEVAHVVIEGPLPVLSRPGTTCPAQLDDPGIVTRGRESPRPAQFGVGVKYRPIGGEAAEGASRGSSSRRRNEADLKGPISVVPSGSRRGAAAEAADA
jgi:hypothetical protein